MASTVHATKRLLAEDPSGVTFDEAIQSRIKVRDHILPFGGPQPTGNSLPPYNVWEGLSVHKGINPAAASFVTLSPALTRDAGADERCRTKMSEQYRALVELYRPHDGLSVSIPDSLQESIDGYVQLEYALLMQIHLASCYTTNFLVDKFQPPYLSR